MDRESFEINIESMASGGEGVAHDDNGRVVFVGHAAVGDRLRVEVTSKKKSWARARITEVISPGPGRIEANCSYFVANQCGGCQWLHLNMPAQIEGKVAMTAAALRHLVADGLEIAPLRSEVSPFGWRRRARLHWFRGIKTERALVGFTAPKSNRITEFDDCSQLAAPLVAAVGEIRRVLGPTLHKRGEIDLLFGTDDKGDPGVAVSVRGPFTKRGLYALAESDSIASVRARGVAVGPETLMIDGGVEARAGDFAQASTEGNRVLREVLVTWLGEPGRVLELFAGAGNLTRVVADGAREVVAVERVEPQVADDMLPDTVSWLIDDTAEACKTLSNSGERFDTVVIDPPRTGAADEMPLIAKLAPERILYVSCNPATLARDALLIADSYRPVRAQPIDLMPQTSHVEVVLELVKR